MKNLKEVKITNKQATFALFQTQKLSQTQQKQLKGGDDFVGVVDDIIQ